MLVCYHDPAVFSTQITSVHLSLITVTVRGTASAAHGAAGGWERFSLSLSHTHIIYRAPVNTYVTLHESNTNMGVILFLYTSRAFLQPDISTRTTFLTKLARVL